MFDVVYIKKGVNIVVVAVSGGRHLLIFKCFDVLTMIITYNKGADNFHCGKNEPIIREIISRIPFVV